MVCVTLWHETLELEPRGASMREVVYRLSVVKQTNHKNVTLEFFEP